MNRKVPLYSLISIIVIACVIIYSFNQKVNNVQDKNDNLFRESLNSAMGGFGVNYNQISNENEKIFYYIETASNLKVARDLTLMTSFNNKNKHLYTSINYLYLCMKNNSTRELVLDEREKIYKYILDISENPTDVQKSKMFEEVVSNIFLSKKE